MNGHSSAETFAFWMLETSRRHAQPIGDGRVAPLFIFSAGRGSAPVVYHCASRGAIRRTNAIDAALAGALGHQLLRASDASGSSAPPSRESAASNGLSALRATAYAQAAFLKSTCASNVVDVTQQAWGAIFTELGGDVALYLKLVFPKAKFVFVHRHPLDAFRETLREALVGVDNDARDLSWAAMFVDQWCRFVASFELWNKEVGGIVVGYDFATSAAAARVTDYLGERLSAAPEGERIDGNVSFPHLRDEEVALITERTGEIGARLGYAFPSRIPRDEKPSGLDAAPPRAFAAHAGATKVSCAVLVPTTRYIEPECDDALNELERRGYAVIRMRGCPWLDQARCILATRAVEQGFDETLWIDADIAFDAGAVERLRSHNLPIVAGIYSRRHPRAGLAVAPVPGVSELVMGDGGGLVEVLYAATGFLLVRREVYTTIQRRFGLPLCNEHTSQRAIPFFMPMLEDWGGRMSYLGEDYAFSRRARLCGFRIMADTSIRLGHIGVYRYGFEDAGNAIERVETYKHVFRAHHGDTDHEGWSPV